MSDKGFTKENLNLYLRELAKEYRKRNGKSMPVEIIMIGEASVVLNYGFRASTYDMDVVMVIEGASFLKDAINYVGDKYHLPNGWVNGDVVKTDSYTPRIIRYSRYYKTLSGVVTFRTVTGEYLLAMKLRAGRAYKYDRSDVIGILWEQEKRGDPLTMDRIRNVVVDLYDSYDVLSDEVKDFIEEAIREGGYETKYDLVRQIEAENKGNLLSYEEEKPGVINEGNVNSVIAALRRKKQQGR